MPTGKRKKKKTKVNTILLCVMLAVMAVSAGALGWNMYKINSSAKDTDNDIKEDKGFYAVLDAEGKNIIATKEATKGSNGAEWQAHQYNGTNYLYFANIFTGTFSTTALDNQYLFFNTNKRYIFFI